MRMLGTFSVLQGAQQTQLPPGGLKAAAGDPEDRVQLSRSRAQHELQRDGELPALRGRRAGFVPEHAAWTGLFSPPLCTAWNQ